MKIGVVDKIRPNLQVSLWSDDTTSEVPRVCCTEGRELGTTDVAECARLVAGQYQCGGNSFSNTAINSQQTRRAKKILLNKHVVKESSKDYAVRPTRGNSYMKHTCGRVF